MNPQESKLLFSEIINGFSIAFHSFFGQVFIKHFSYCESGELDVKYYEYLDLAKKSNIPTYKSQEEYIISNNLWSKKDEEKLEDEIRLIKALRENLSKDFLYSRRQNLKKDIREAELRLNAISNKKNHYIGNTAELFSNKKLTFYKICNSFFKDKTLKNPLIKDTYEFDDDDNYHEMIKSYNEFQEKFNNENIKKIALSPFFMGIFNLAGDSIYEFYGKPIIKLTDFQSNIVMYGRYFKSIIENQGASIPEDIRADPEQLMEWMNIRDNAKEQKVIGNESEEGNRSIVGATKNDLKILGLQVPDKNPMTEALRKSGGILNAEELYNLNK